MTLRLSEIPNALSFIDGYPCLEGRLLFRHVRENHPREEWHEEITAFSRQWLLLLRKAATETADPARSNWFPYAVHESPNFLLLHSLHPHCLQDALSHLEKMYAKLNRDFASLLPANGYGKNVVLFFHHERCFQRHYQSLGYTAPPTSWAYFVSHNHAHAVFLANRVNDEVLVALTHELLHGLVGHRPLPHWLNEGFAQFYDVRGVLKPVPLLLHTLRRFKKTYWQSHDLIPFWTGQAFFTNPDERHEAYEFARILFRHLHKISPDQTLRLLADASYKDHGESALQTHFALTLPQLAAQLLGPAKPK